MEDTEYTSPTVSLSPPAAAPSGKIINGLPDFEHPLAPESTPVKRSKRSRAIRTPRRKKAPPSAALMDGSDSGESLTRENGIPLIISFISSKRAPASASRKKKPSSSASSFDGNTSGDCADPRDIEIPASIDVHAPIRRSAATILKPAILHDSNESIDLDDLYEEARREEEALRSSRSRKKASATPRGDQSSCSPSRSPRRRVPSRSKSSETTPSPRRKVPIRSCSNSESYCLATPPRRRGSPRHNHKSSTSSSDGFVRLAAPSAMALPTSLLSDDSRYTTTTTSAAAACGLISMQSSNDDSSEQIAEFEQEQEMIELAMQRSLNDSHCSFHSGYSSSAGFSPGFSPGSSFSSIRNNRVHAAHAGSLLSSGCREQARSNEEDDLFDSLFGDHPDDDQGVDLSLREGETEAERLERVEQEMLTMALEQSRDDFNASASIF